ncbi:MAG: 50S ribosomal protein L6 [Parcubacteria group bacterium GW2011_GWA1_47_8]|nr:MAG: 50S ribosomal protein L6 [Parcubacteria group bacterium GW2011_GWA1_47_8]KKW07271.1 MAG: 50S ribosomal protein L6 [Parcubacteria group bacterium GW2011_GWA2_49_16]
MSRIGKKGVTIPTGTTVTQNGTVFTVKGPLGELTRDFPGPINIKIEGAAISLAPKNNSKEAKALWGTYASHLVNMVSGVTKAFEKKLQIEGVGYKVEQQGTKLVFSLGFSHKVPMETPKDVKAVVEKNTITLSSINKESVGMFAAQIRANKKPEPYKGKGIRYSDEVVRRKQGKKSA